MKDSISEQIHQNQRNDKFITVVQSNDDGRIQSFYRILKCKLECMEDYFKKDYKYNNTVHLKWLRMAIKLCKRFTEEDINEYPEYINIKNAKNYVESNDFDFNANSKKNTSKIKSKIYKQVVDEIDYDRIYREMFYDAKAKHLLFKIIANYITFFEE